MGVAFARHRLRDVARLDLEVFADHLGQEIVQAGLMHPSESIARLGAVAEQEIDLGRPEIPRVDLDEDPPGRDVDAAFLGVGAAPFDVDSDFAEGLLDERTDRCRDTGREDIVVGLILPQHQPHAVDEVTCVAPVALSVEVADVKLVLQPEVDRRYGARHLAGDEGLAPQWTFMIASLWFDSGSAKRY